MNDENSEKLKTPPPWLRLCAVFIIALLILLITFAIPVPHVVVDILWGFSFCLAGAAIMICFSAQNSYDLNGFVPIVSGLILLRLIVLVCTARRIVEVEPTGILINSIGNILAIYKPLGMVFIFLLLAIAGVIIIFISCQRIATASHNYIRQIFPLKKMGLDTDLKTGLINKNNAKTLSQRITEEFRFFSQMNSTSVLMRGESVICIFTLLICLLAPIFSKSFHTVSGMEFIDKTTPAFLALSLFSLFPAVIVAAACGRLMNKETLTLRMQTQEQTKPRPKKIVLSSTVTEEDKSAETQDDELIEQDRTPQPVLAPAAETDSERVPIPSEVIELTCDDASQYYEKLSQLISQLESRPRIALLASDQIQSLPATVAVNVAILLAQKKQNVLLIDAETERNAVAQIFEMDPDAIRKEIMPSCLENLSIHSLVHADFEDLLKQENTLKRFDATLVYMPDTHYLDGKTPPPWAHPDVFYFTKRDDDPLDVSIKDSFTFGQSLRFLPCIRSVMK